MQLDQNPFFRKAITPWYDSNPACWCLISIMILVFVFAVAGIFVGFSSPQFKPHAWFPGLLAFLSFFLIFKVYFRLRKRERNN